MQMQLYLTALTQNLKRLVSRSGILLWRLWAEDVRLPSLPEALLALVTSSDLVGRGFSTARLNFYKSRTVRFILYPPFCSLQESFSGPQPHCAPHPARRSTSVVADTPVSPEALRRSAGLGHLDPEQARAYWRDRPREFDYVLWMHGAEAVDAEGLPLEPVARGRTVDLYRIVTRPS